MRAVTFNVTIPGFLAAKTLGRVYQNAPFGIFGTVRGRELSPPELPGPDWARLEVVACGICGTDVSTVTYGTSTALEPFGSFPAVLGHEILGRVVEKGDGVSGVEVGQRISVNPMIPCAARGFAEPCPACADGHFGICHHGGDEGPTEINGRPMGRGLTIGYHRDLPGGYAEQVIAHRDQIHPVPDALSDRVAVLTEPLCVGLHAVLNTELHPAEPVLVIGSGSIALATIWGLRASGFTGEIFSQTKRAHEAELARRLGATANVTPGPEARRALIDTGARAYQPIIGPEVYAGGGFPVIFDCVGSAGSLDQALRFAAARGRIVMLGCAAQISDLDLSPIWSRELEVRGFVGYAPERWRGETRHTFAIAHQLMQEAGDGLDGFVTHELPLAEYCRGLVAAANHRQSGAVKVVLHSERWGAG